MVQKKNIVSIALKSMRVESLRRKDFAMERCLSGCLKSLEVTSIVVAKLEDLRVVRGFSCAMIKRIEDRFNEGPLMCDCNNISKNVEDLIIHMRSHHQKKKKLNKDQKKNEQPKGVDISGLNLPEEGSAAYAVIMALNSKEKELTKSMKYLTLLRGQ